MRKITNPYALAALATTGGLLFGFDISSMSAILATPNYKVYFGPKDLVTDCPGRPGALCSPGPNSDLQGGITASMAGGSFLGALASGVLTDRLGRRAAIFAACILWIIGSIISCASQNVAMLIVGRVINGACVGIASAQVPVYLSELSPANMRGRLVGAQQWAITWGICVFYYVSYGCSFIGKRIDGEQDGRGTASFRTPWGLQVIPAILLMAMVPMMPESPRWLASKGRYTEALEVIALVHGNGDPNSASTQREFEEIKEVLDSEKHVGNGYLALFSEKYIWRTHIAVFTQIWSQLTGMNVMMYYITYVFQMAGMTGNIALVSSSIQYVINVVMTIPALLYMDKWGRRPTLMIGSTFMTIWLFTVAGLMASYGHYVSAEESGNSVVRWIVHGKPAKGIIACSFLFVASFAPTWGPVSWVYPPELFPTGLRSFSGSLSTMANWAFNCALGFFVPPAFEHIQWKAYLIFGVFTVAMTIHVFFAFPETANKPLEEVDEIFESRVPAWKTRRIAFTNKLKEPTHDDLETGKESATANTPGSEEKER